MGHREGRRTRTPWRRSPEPLMSHQANCEVALGERSSRGRSPKCIVAREVKAWRSGVRGNSTVLQIGWRKGLLMNYIATQDDIQSEIIEENSTRNWCAFVESFGVACASFYVAVLADP